MSLPGKIARSYKRWRHRQGFGVHSPFAYRMVRDVIRRGGHYYAVVRFRRHVAPLPRRYKREYALVFRLVARLAPERIQLAGSVESQLEPLIHLADTRADITHGFGDYSTPIRTLTILSATDLRRGIPEGILRPGNLVYLRELRDCPEILQKLKAQMNGGWVFADSGTAIFVSDDNEPMNIIDIKMI